MGHVRVFFFFFFFKTRGETPEISYSKNLKSGEEQSHFNAWGQCRPTMWRRQGGSKPQTLTGKSSCIRRGAVFRATGIQAEEGESVSALPNAGESWTSVTLHAKECPSADWGGKPSSCGSVRTSFPPLYTSLHSAILRAPFGFMPWLIGSNQYLASFESRRMSVLLPITD